MACFCVVWCSFVVFCFGFFCLVRPRRGNLPAKQRGPKGFVGEGGFRKSGSLVYREKEKREEPPTGPPTGWSTTTEVKHIFLKRHIYFLEAESFFCDFFSFPMIFKKQLDGIFLELCDW